MRLYLIERSMKLASLLVVPAALLVSGLVLAQDLKIPGVAIASPIRKDKVVLTPAEWQKKLTKEQFDILRAKGTEPAFCGVNLDQKGEGTYYCVGCGLDLFFANSKFNSGTGWPSFYKPIDRDRIWTHTDRSFGMVRTEVNCARCDGHLGHVFNDGPAPTGLRFCMNGKVLKFVPKKAEKAHSGN